MIGWSNIEKQLEGLDAPARAFALARAAYQLADENSRAEQTTETARLTADDPEPADGWRAEGWRAWFVRSRLRLEPMSERVIAKHNVLELRKLYELAESNLVDSAEERLARKFADRFAAIAPAFEAYRDHRLYGDRREQFLKICFNCPAA